jgi:hypothetical protein
VLSAELGAKYYSLGDLVPGRQLKTYLFRYFFKLRRNSICSTRRQPGSVELNYPVACLAAVFDRAYKPIIKHQRVIHAR